MGLEPRDPVLYRRRRRTNAIMMGIAGLALAFGLGALGWILVTLIGEGIGALRWSLFTEMTPPPGSDGGLANAIFGSILMAGVGTAIGNGISVALGASTAGVAVLPPAMFCTVVGVAVVSVVTGCALPASVAET